MAKNVNKKDKTITIDLNEYVELLNDSETLNTLKAYGVDNWEGYGEGFDEMVEQEVDDFL